MQQASAAPLLQPELEGLRCTNRHCLWPEHPLADQASALMPQGPSALMPQGPSSASPPWQPIDRKAGRRTELVPCRSHRRRCNQHQRWHCCRRLPASSSAGDHPQHRPWSSPRSSRQLPRFPYFGHLRCWQRCARSCLPMTTSASPSAQTAGHPAHRHRPGMLLQLPWVWRRCWRRSSIQRAVQPPPPRAWH